MSFHFQAKINLAPGAITPDIYDGSTGQVPRKNFVVSRHSDGSSASFYGDESWDWSPYSNDGRSSPLNFSFWGDGKKPSKSEELLGDIHWLMFLIIFVREGNALSYASLVGYLKILRPLARHCEQSDITVRALLSDEDLLVAYITNSMTPRLAEYLSPLLSMLLKLGDQIVGFSTPGNGLLKKLHAIIQYNKGFQKQTAPIPTRIYSEIISGISRELDNFEVVADRLLSLAAECAADPFLGRAQRTQRQYAQQKNIKLGGYRPSFAERLDKYDLHGYFDSQSLSKSVLGVSEALRQVQMATKLTVHVFSGMRNDEVTSLLYDCLDEPVQNEKKHCIIVGATTKLNNGKLKSTRWITGKEGYRAIRIAQNIADIIYHNLGVAPKTCISDNGAYPLFVSLTYLNLAGQLPKSPTGCILPSFLNLTNHRNLRSRLQPLIEECDLRELEQIDAERNWRSEDLYQLGKPWTLATHQLRRSLALYAQRSGLVSLPTLRRQLKHITQEMTQYYSKGSPFAQNFIGDDKGHFGYEWQETTSVSSAISYLANVIFSDTKLFGGHGNHVECHLRDSDSAISRENIMMQFKRGEIAYKETPLGGCVKVGDCDQVGFRMLDVDCVLSGCKNLVGAQPKLNRVIEAQTRLVSSLDTESVGFRMEQSDLDALVAMRDSLADIKNTEVT